MARNVTLEDLTPTERRELVAIAKKQAPQDLLAVANLLSSEPRLVDVDKAATALGLQFAAGAGRPL